MVSSVGQLCPTLCDPTRLLCPWDSPGKNTGVGRHSLPSPGIFPTQGSNPGLLHCRSTLHTLSHRGSLILYNRFSLIIYFIHSINNVYMSMPIFHLPFPVGIYTFVLYICVSISVLPIKSSISFFWIPHICINIQNYVSTSILFHSILQSLGQPHLCK